MTPVSLCPTVTWADGVLLLVHLRRPLTVPTHEVSSKQYDVLLAAAGCCMLLAAALGWFFFFFFFFFLS